MSRIANLCLLACALIFSCVQAAAAQSLATLTLTVENVPSAKGQVLASLCDDPKAQVPGPCRTYSTKATAQAGITTLLFTGIKPGVYALQVFQDQNENGRLDFPQEGYAFGNDAPFPPNFAAASVTVAGDTTTHVHLVNVFSNGTGLQGTNGVAPPEGVTKTDLRTDGLYGELYTPAHTSPLPLIIAIGGSEGGLDTISALSVSFARRGFAVLAFAYWKEPGLPQSLEGIPLEYFDHAIAWAQNQPAIDPKRIGMIGWSRGAEAALLVGSRNPDLHAIMAVSPSAYVWQGLNFSNLTGPMNPAWTAGGTPLSSIVPANMRPGNRMVQMFADKLGEAEQRQATIIPVEKINGPILLLSGSDDALWPSDLMSDRIIARLRASHFGYAFAHKNYNGAGHAVFIGDPVTSQFDTSAIEKFMGGTADSNSLARQDSWKVALQFFTTALQGKSP